MYDKFLKMEIDDDKERFDLSDHNFIRAYFNIIYDIPQKYGSCQTKSITYFKINEETK